jgi:peptidoglycan/LPS O-acetylase OafA/YrhL
MSYLDGLRGLAALNVALAHFLSAFDFAVLTGHPEYAHGAWEITISAFPFLFPAAGANFAVCIFFALSGFVLAKSFHSSDSTAIAMVVKRTIRLGLPVVAASLLGWAVLSSGLSFNQSAAAETRSVWLSTQFGQQPSLLDALHQAYNSLLGAPTLQTSYNSSLWTMPIEYIGSILLIVAFATGLPARSPRLAGVLFLALGLIFCRAFVSIMLFGAALYLLDIARFAVRMRLRAVMLAVILALGTLPFSEARGPIRNALLLITAHVPPVPVSTPGFTAQGDVSLWHGVAAVALVALISGWPAVQRGLSVPIVASLGRLSFPLYLAHIPILLSVGCFSFLVARGAGLPYAAAVGISFAVYLPATLCAAMVLERFVDGPSMRMAGRVAENLTRPATDPAPAPLA